MNDHDESYVSVYDTGTNIPSPFWISAADQVCVVIVF